MFVVRTMRLSALCFVAAIASTTLSSCNTYPGPAGTFEQTSSASETAAPSGAAEAAGEMAVADGSALPAGIEQKGGEYLISNDDAIEVSVYQVPDLSRTVQVDGKGNIKLPLIGNVRAAGRSVPDLEAEITKRLKDKYLQDPQVTVFLKDAVGQRVTVQGAVEKPGVYPSKGKMTLMQAIAVAGGYKDIADTSAIFIVRQTETGRMGARFDGDAIKTGEMEDPVLMGGDMIVVDQSGGLAAWKRLREASSFSFLAWFLI